MALDMCICKNCAIFDWGKVHCTREYFEEPVRWLIVRVVYKKCANHSTEIKIVLIARIGVYSELQTRAHKHYD